ncbi:hypothetical protein H6P81_018799 [Aristolochia fimbriata]|uniref:Uncharacterized protein n=1 Tax=Aristolochia fimbriata TaxID=158543 RepID=A0AAV7E497_ARIFI|nr:hypothetical protein H6P81_018799 [Aristolochia fimbriata]
MFAQRNYSNIQRQHISCSYIGLYLLIIKGKVPRQWLGYTIFLTHDGFKEEPGRRSQDLPGKSFDKVYYLRNRRDAKD